MTLMKPLETQGEMRVRSMFTGGGGRGIRTPDPLNAIQVLYQLSYTPTKGTVNAAESSTAKCQRDREYREADRACQRGNSRAGREPEFPAEPRRQRRRSRRRVWLGQRTSINAVYSMIPLRMLPTTETICDALSPTP